jgi:hypothetical protein
MRFRGQRILNFHYFGEREKLHCPVINEPIQYWGFTKPEAPFFSEKIKALRADYPKKSLRFNRVGP